MSETADAEIRRPLELQLSDAAFTELREALHAADPLKTNWLGDLDRAGNPVIVLPTWTTSLRIARQS